MRARLVVAVAVAALCGVPEAFPGQGMTFETAEVAAEVYVFRPSELGVGNVVAIVTSGGVLVVDSSLTPAGGSAVVAAIRALTDQPVSVVVTTHAHDDHFWGNQALRAAFPEARFVAHTATRRDLLEKTIPGLEANRGAIAAGIEQRQARLDAGIDADGAPMSEEQRAALSARLRMFRDLAEQMSRTVPVPATEVFDTEMVFTLGDTEIELLHLGAGHTTGDAVVRVPGRGVVVAGDLLTYPIPAAGEAMLELAPTLRHLAALDAAVLVPGHGDLPDDRAYLWLVIETVEELVRQVRDAVDAGLSLEETLAVVDLGPYEERLVHDDAAAQGAFREFFVKLGVENLHRDLTRGR